MVLQLELYVKYPTMTVLALLEMDLKKDPGVGKRHTFSPLAIFWARLKTSLLP